MIENKHIFPNEIVVLCVYLLNSKSICNFVGTGQSLAAPFGI